MYIYKKICVYIYIHIIKGKILFVFEGKGFLYVCLDYLTFFFGYRHSNDWYLYKVVLL